MSGGGRARQTWHLQHGQWSSWAWLDAAPSQSVAAGDDACVFLAYDRASFRLGMTYGAEIHLYPRKQGVSDVPPYLIEVSDGGKLEWVSAGTFPDAMDLLTRWAPVMTAAILTEAYQGLAGGGRGGILTNSIALARANEDEIGREHRRILGEREQQNQRWAERLARPQDGAA